MLELRVDTDLQTTLPSEISFNFEELKTELAERLEHYNNLIVTEDGIKEAKSDRAKLNKLRSAIDARRKDLKKEYLKPYNDFEARIKELTGLIDQPIVAIDTQLETYEERRKEAKAERVRELYEDTIPENLKDIIPLTRIGDPKWLNATTTMKSVTEDLQNWEKRVNADLLALDALEEEYKAAAKVRYIDTLDISEALAEKDRIIKAQEAFIAREEARKAREAEEKAREEERQAREAARAAEAKIEPPAPEPTMAEPEEKMYALRLEFRVTRDQALALRRYIDEAGITYKKF